MNFCARPLYVSLLLLNLSGCASLLGLVHKPTAAFSKVEVKDPTLTEAEFDVSFEVTNPNPVSLNLASLTYALDVAGKSLSSGTFEKGVQLPANGSSTITIPLTIKYLEAFDSLENLFKNPESPYTVAGTFKVGPFEIPFSYAGQMKLPSMPKVEIKTFRRTNKNPLNPEFALDISVQNANAFRLDLQKLNYGFLLSGKRIIEGLAPVTNLAANETTQVSLPMRVSLTQLGLTLAQLRKTKTLPFEFTGRFDFPIAGPVNFNQIGTIPLKL